MARGVAAVVRVDNRGKKDRASGSAGNERETFPGKRKREEKGDKRPPRKKEREGTSG